MSPATQESQHDSQWVEKLNERYAITERGGKIYIADSDSPTETARGIVKGLNFIPVETLRSRYAGQFAPQASPDAKPIPLINAWLSHGQRRQYQATVFLPGEDVPEGVLNLWRGFAIEPEAGDVNGKRATPPRAPSRPKPRRPRPRLKSPKPWRPSWPRPKRPSARSRSPWSARRFRPR